MENKELTAAQRLYLLKYKSDFFFTLNFEMFNLNCAFAKIYASERRWIFRKMKKLTTPSKSQSPEEHSL